MHAYLMQSKCRKRAGTLIHHSAASADNALIHHKITEKGRKTTVIKNLSYFFEIDNKPVMVSPNASKSTKSWHTSARNDTLSLEYP